MTYQKNTPIKDIPKSDRPREKLIKYGPAKLSKSELLAVLLGSGNPGENVVALAKRVLGTVGSSQLPQTGFTELKKIVGLGEAKASTIVVAFELGQRLLKGKETKLLITPQDVYKELGYLYILKFDRGCYLALTMGKKTQSRIGLSIKKENTRSESPKPTVGGRPCSRASI